MKQIIILTIGILLSAISFTQPKEITPQILKQIKALNIPVIINSDSHHPTEITTQYAETAEKLLEMGFKILRVLINGQWQDLPFDRQGLIY